MTERPILNRKETAALIGVTLEELARMEAEDDSIVRAAGVRTTFGGKPTIRYRRVAVLRWLQGIGQVAS